MVQSPPKVTLFLNDGEQIKFIPKSAPSRFIKKKNNVGDLILKVKEAEKL